MKIQVLGTGCAKCTKLYDNTKKAIDELGCEAEIVKVTDIREIMSFKVITTPALAVDGKVKVSGRVPSAEDIKALIQG